MSRKSGLEPFAKGALLLALIQALLFWLLHQSIDALSWPASDPQWLLAAYLITTFVPLTLLLSWSHRRQRVLWWAAGGLAIFLGLAGYQSFADVSVTTGELNLDEDRIAGFLLPWLVAWLVALPMLRARLESGRWRAGYSSLFRSSWRSYLTLAESALFTGVFWLLLQLWAELFETLGNDFFRGLFNDPRFIYPATTLAFAAATQIIGSSDRFIDGVLDQLLGLMKWLLPLAGLIVVVFSIALVPKLPELIGTGQKILNSAILLALVAATLLLFNAAFREGDVDPGYGPLLQQALRIVPPLLVLIAVTAMYSMSVRLFDLGLTPARYWGLVTATFAILYSTGYAYASLRSGPWLGAIKEVNSGVSLLLLVTLLVSLTPVADPLRLSVASQLKRAITESSAEARESALRFLRFDASDRGRVALASIIREAQSVELKEEAKRIAALESNKLPPKADPAATPARYAAWRSKLQVVPIGSPIDSSLEEAMRGEFMLSASALDPGGNAPVPRLVFVDLDGDDRPEALLLSGTLRGSPQHLRDYRVLRNEGGRWERWSGGVWR